MNGMDTTVQDTIKTPNQEYVQLAYNTRSQCYELLHRKQRYSTPTLLETGLGFESAEKILEEAQQQGIQQILTTGETR